MIRLATSADVPRLVEMGLRFREESGYSKHIAKNAEKMAETAAALVDAGGVLVSDRDGVVGMIGIFVFPHFLSAEIVAGEVFWYVVPEHRGDGVRLLRAAERLARERGAERLQMIAPNDHVAAFYQRLGYEYVESTFQKSLSV